MGRKNAAVWGNSRISEDDELKPVSKLKEEGTIHAVSNFGVAGMAAWVVKKHLGKMFCTPLFLWMEIM